MNKYLMYSNMRIKKELFYKTNIMGLLLTTIVALVIQLQLWNSIFGTQMEIAGISYSSVILYLVVGMIYRKFLGSGTEHVISDSFKKGDIAVDWCRPQSFFLKMIADDIGRAIVHITAAIGVIGLFLIVTKHEFMHISLETIFFSIISSLLAYMIFFMMSFCIGLLSVWFGTSIGVSIVKQGLFSLLGGVLIPLDFYPTWILSIVRYLPFKYIYYSPISFYLKEIDKSEIIKIYIIQVLWIIIFGVCCAKLYNSAKKDLVIQGG